MENITKSLHSVYTEVVTKHNQLEADIKKYDALIIALEKARKELIAREKQLDIREKSVGNAESIQKMFNDAQGINKQNNAETDRLNALLVSTNKNIDAKVKELTDRKIAIDNANSDLALRERDLINGQKQLKIDRENLKKSILEEISKKF